MGIVTIKYFKHLDDCQKFLERSDVEYKNLFENEIYQPV